MAPRVARYSLAVLTIVAATGISSAAADTPDCFGLKPTIVGTDGDDHLDGTSGVDVMQEREVPMPSPADRGPIGSAEGPATTESTRARVTIQ